MPIFRVSMDCHMVVDVEAPDFAQAKQRADKERDWMTNLPGVFLKDAPDFLADDNAVLYVHKDEPVQVMYMICPDTGDAISPTQAERFGMGCPAMQPKNCTVEAEIGGQMIVGNPVSASELAEIINNIQSGKTSILQEIAKNTAPAVGTAAGMLVGTGPVVARKEYAGQKPQTAAGPWVRPPWYDPTGEYGMVKPYEGWPQHGDEFLAAAIVQDPENDPTPRIEYGYVQLGGRNTFDYGLHEIDWIARLNPPPQ